MSKVVTTAYQVLLNPLSRVQHILSQHGVEVLEEPDEHEHEQLIREVTEAEEALEDAKFV